MGDGNLIGDDRYTLNGDYPMSSVHSSFQFDDERRQRERDSANLSPDVFIRDRPNPEIMGSSNSDFFGVASHTRDNGARSTGSLVVQAISIILLLGAGLYLVFAI